MRTIPTLLAAAAIAVAPITLSTPTPVASAAPCTGVAAIDEAPFSACSNCFVANPNNQAGCEPSAPPLPIQGTDKACQQSGICYKPGYGPGYGPSGWKTQPSPTPDPFCSTTGEKGFDPCGKPTPGAINAAAHPCIVETLDCVMPSPKAYVVDPTTGQVTGELCGATGNWTDFCHTDAPEKTYLEN
jgi:hypothetical protein